MKYGLGGFLYVKCDYTECNNINKIPYGTRHGKRNTCWDINTKLASGMIDSGIGESMTNCLLANMNLPSVSHPTLKRRALEAGEQIVNLANDSCVKALSEEGEQANGNISASFDGAWQKRGTGKAYNSLSGHASLFGEKTKKCIAFNVKCKRCRICAVASAKKTSPRIHKCRANWTGSAKAMEPAMACDMLKDIKSKGYNVGTIIMDNDSTTIARARAEVDHDLKKRSDKNHTKKALMSSLIEMSTKRKNLKNYKVRNYIVRNVMYAAAQNKDDPERVKACIQQIVPHIFGEHEKCDKWCDYRKDPSTFRFKCLPYGKPLTDEALRQDLTKLLDRYAAKSSDMASLGSSQINESFNHMVASKAPKSR
jgi:hypothetical protein